MRRLSLTLSTLVLAALAGCGGDSAASGSTAPATKPADKPAAQAPAGQAKQPAAQAPAAKAPAANQPDAAQLAAANADVQAALKDVQLPTQAEADAQAAQAITDQNADAEFEKLQQELGGAAAEPPK